MATAPILWSTENVLDGLRAETAALAADLGAGSVGLPREAALGLAERIEDLGRQVDLLRLVAARAVDLAAPTSAGSGALVDHGAAPGGGECEPLVTPLDDGRAPFARARDLLRDRLRISGKEAARRLRLAGLVCERVTVTGEVLPPLRPHLAKATGHVDVEAVTEIVRVLDRAGALTNVEAEVVERLEQTLVDHARTFDPDRIRMIGAHAVAVLDPDGAEPTETEARSRQGVHIGRLYRGLATVKLVVDALQLETLQTAFDAGSNPRTTTPPLIDPDGNLSPRSPAEHPSATPSDSAGGHDERARGAEERGADEHGADEHGAAEHGADEHGAAASVDTADGDVPAHPADRRTRPQRQLDALVAAVAAAIRHGALPATGGTPTQVLVTINATDLAPPRPGPGIDPPAGRVSAVTSRSSTGPPRAAPPYPTPPGASSLAPSDPLKPGPGVALLPHAGLVPASAVRHLACDATVTAVILGRGRRVLSLGRSVRIVPPAMRLAVIARDGTDCAFPGCSIPATWCEAHHIVGWQRGGVTSIDNTVMLCPHHHKLSDAGHWTIHQARPGASPTFKPAR